MSIISLAAHSQIVPGDFHYRPDDAVKKKQVMYSNAGMKSKNAVWDFSGIELMEKEHIARTWESDDSTTAGMIAVKENGIRQYFRQREDSILLAGSESSLMRTVFDREELQLILPLEYGQKNCGLFHGTSAYGEKLYMRVFGSYMSEVDAMGIMLLPSGDTLRHVARVHLTRLAAKQDFPGITTVAGLKTYVDSIAPFTADSIRQYIADSTHLVETNIYRWYAAGYRYPVYETIATGIAGGEPDYLTAFYCPTEEQALMYDEENEEIRRLLAKEDGEKTQEDGGSDDKCRSQSDGGRNSSAAENVSISVSGSSVVVSYDLTTDATVKALVCDVSGIVRRQNSQSGIAGSSYRMVIECYGLRHGEYIIYLNVNGIVKAYAVNI